MLSFKQQVFQSIHIKDDDNMKKIGLFLLLIAFISGCGNTSNDEEPAGSNESSETAKDSNDEEESTKEEAMPFDAWLETVEVPYKEMILPNLDEMSTEEIITHYRSELEVPEDWISVAYTDLITDETYHHNETEVMTAASTTKVLLAMLYFDLVESEMLNMDTYIPYYDGGFEEGGGNITADVVNGVGQNSYSLDYTIQEMIIRSDNTATNMLRRFYTDNFGPLGEGMHSVIPESDYTAEMLEQNTTSAALLEETLLALLANDAYAPIIEHMRSADENLYFKYYIEEDMPVKYGLLYELQHHTGIYEVDGNPAYSLVVMTKYLEQGQANELMGGINLQLAVRAQYQHYLENL